MRDKLRAIPVFANVRTSEFSEKELPGNPLPAVAEWIFAAADAGQQEPHAMSLCTVSSAGIPSSRVLLVKDIDDEQLFFATSSGSRKGLEIAATSHVSAHFYWPAVGRQVRIVGTAVDRGRAESESDFAERGHGSRLSAHLHRPGPLASRQAALDEFGRLGEAYPDTVPCPPGWTLYALVPTEIELWEASADRVHHRVVYRRDGGTGPWRRELMWP